jgi:hypothetical protein
VRRGLPDGQRENSDHRERPRPLSGPRRADPRYAPPSASTARTKWRSSASKRLCGNRRSSRVTRRSRSAVEAVAAMKGAPVPRGAADLRHGAAPPVRGSPLATTRQTSGCTPNNPWSALAVRPKLPSIFLPASRKSRIWPAQSDNDEGPRPGEGPGQRPFSAGGRCRIRTCVGIRRRIYRRRGQPADLPVHA